MFELERALSEECPYSADAAIDFAGNVRIRVDSTTKIDELCPLLYRSESAVKYRSVYAKLGTDRMRIDSVFLPDTVNPSSRQDLATGPASSA